MHHQYYYGFCLSWFITLMMEAISPRSTDEIQKISFMSLLVLRDSSPCRERYVYLMERPTCPSPAEPHPTVRLLLGWSASLRVWWTETLIWLNYINIFWTIISSKRYTNRSNICQESHIRGKDLSEILCELPDCIHSLVLSDELNELLNSQTELKTALPKNQTNVSQVSSQTLRANRDCWNGATFILRRRDLLSWHQAKHVAVSCLSRDSSTSLAVRNISMFTRSYNMRQKWTPTC